jgi:hypothetical protein
VTGLSKLRVLREAIPLFPFCIFPEERDGKKVEKEGGCCFVPPETVVMFTVEAGLPAACMSVMLPHVTSTVF